VSIDFYRYTIFPDYGMAPYAWLVEAGVESHGVGYCAGSATGWNGHKPISENLQNEFAQWAIHFENEVDCNCGPDTNFDWCSFHKQGVALSVSLKQELGADSLVYYVKGHEDPNHDIEGRMIIMDDGTVKELSAINEYIPDAMEKIERDHNVRVLYAVESGSRAWGFASRNSDFDVRFIYIHQPDWYLSIRERRDVIEIPINDDLDISGWDIRKALGLFAKSNPPLLEWLGSPIVYLDEFGFADRLRTLLQESFSPQRCMHHYLHMARGNYREYLKGEMVRLKKYLYVLRPILACLWLEKHGTMPPTEFSRLRHDADLSSTLDNAIEELLQKKMAGEELDMAPHVPVLNEFIEQQLEHFSLIAGKRPTPVADYDVLDNLFREMLHVCHQPD